MKLSDNTVFITGGASGIGLALAKGFLELFPPLTDIDMTRDREDDIHKESPDFVASKFFSKFAKDHYEVKPGLMNIMLLQMNRFLPSVVEKIAKKR